MHACVLHVHTLDLSYLSSNLLTCNVLQYIESPDVEKEVKRLLSTDAEAVSVRILL